MAQTPLAQPPLAQTFEHRVGATPGGETTDGVARGASRWTIWALALFAGALFGAAILLWVRHGATVFFDTMSAGIAACL